jgi:hypothetical protein
MREYIQMAQELEQTLEREAHHRNAAASGRARYRQAKEREHYDQLHRNRKRRSSAHSPSSATSAGYKLNQKRRKQKFANIALVHLFLIILIDIKLIFNQQTSAATASTPSSTTAAERQRSLIVRQLFKRAAAVYEQPADCATTTIVVASASAFPAANLVQNEQKFTKLQHSKTKRIR